MNYKITKRIIAVVGCIALAIGNVSALTYVGGSYKVAIMDEITLDDQYARAASAEGRLATLFNPPKWKEYGDVVNILSSNYFTANVQCIKPDEEEYVYHSFDQGVNGVAVSTSVCFTIEIVAPTGVEITSEPPSRMLVDEKLTLSHRLIGPTLPRYKSSNAGIVYEYTTSAPNVLAVSNSGLITALSAGKATVTVTAKAVNRSQNNLYTIGSDSHTIEVVESYEPESISLSQHSISLGVDETAPISATVLPTKASQEVEWSSSDPSIAFVQNGYVQALKEGNTIITATTSNGLSDFCNVQVTSEFTVNALRYKPIDEETVAVISNATEKYSGNIVVPETISFHDKIYTVTEIGDSAFKDCSELNSIIFPKSVYYIGPKAFYLCTSLTSLRLYATLYDTSAFEGCSGLKTIQMIVQPNTCFGDSVFMQCDNITGVYINDLYNWTQIYYNNTASNPLWSANADLYLNGEKVTDLVIPNNVKTICFSTFAYCRSIETLTVQDGTEDIGAGAFCGTTLRTISLPASLSAIEAQAFAYCHQLESVSCAATTPPNMAVGWEDWDFDDYFPFLDCDLASVTLHVPKGSESEYYAAPGWNRFGIIIGDIVSTDIDKVEIEAENVHAEYFTVQGVSAGNDDKSLRPGIYIKYKGGKTQKIII